VVGNSKWGYGVYVLFIGFVLFILTLIIYVSSQDMQIVEADYYKKAYKYQDHINNKKNSRQLAVDVKIEYDPAKDKILILFPNSTSDLEGKIQLFRPSDIRLDRKFTIEVDSLGIQEINVENFIAGLWKIKIDWSVDTVAYYYQSPLYLE